MRTCVKPGELALTRDGSVLIVSAVSSRYGVDSASRVFAVTTRAFSDGSVEIRAEAASWLQRPKRLLDERGRAA